MICIIIFSCIIVYLILFLLLWRLIMDGHLRRVYSRIHMSIIGIKEGTLDEVMNSITSHSLEYNKKFVQFDAKVKRRISINSVVISHRDSKIWWYVKTNEKSGHDTMNHIEGETYPFTLYIREIEYDYLANKGIGRYIVSSHIVER